MVPFLISCSLILLYHHYLQSKGHKDASLQHRNLCWPIVRTERKIVQVVRPTLSKQDTLDYHQDARRAWFKN